MAKFYSLARAARGINNSQFSAHKIVTAHKIVAKENRTRTVKLITISSPSGAVYSFFTLSTRYTAADYSVKAAQSHNYPKEHDTSM